MILKYVWKNFTQRKVRTILMVLSLLISVGLLVALSATVETVKQSSVDIIASEVGRFDLTLLKTDIARDPFISVDDTIATVQQVAPAITELHPRFQAIVELSGGGKVGGGYVVALDPDREDIGIITVVEGEYALGDGQAALLESTSFALGVGVGDVVEVSYSLPQPREEGRVGNAGTSQRRAIRTFTITSIIRQDGVTSSDIFDGLFIHLDDAQTWLGLSGRAERLVGIIDPAIQDSQDAEATALAVRDVALTIQGTLGDDYTYSLAKAAILDEAAQSFVIFQAIINIYGITALGIVGLLVHTLVMTNVQEQQRDMAILRILGGQQKVLFGLVIVEVFVVGVIGLTAGILLGQLVTTYAVVPIITAQMANAGINITLVPRVTASVIIPPIVSTAIVLFVSTLKPAQTAANTKVMHAINPGVADNIQIEDIAQLRERRPSGRLFLTGILMSAMVLLVFSLEFISTFGNPALQASIILVAVMFMVAGIGFIFFITTVPFEKLILAIATLIVPRLAYFAKRNVGRGQTRNTLISLLVLFSGILPSFLATQAAFDEANVESDVRISMGADIRMSVFTGWQDPNAALKRLRPSFLTDELGNVPEITNAVGRTYAYNAGIADSVGLRTGSGNVYGVTGNLADVLYLDMVDMQAGGLGAFDTILQDPEAVIISEGLADYLAVPLGGTVRLTGEGLDHQVNVKIAGIARRIPSFRFSQSRQTSRFGGDILMSVQGFRQLTTDPLQALPPENDPILDRIIGTLDPNAIPVEVVETLNNRFNLSNNISSRSTAVRMASARQEAVQSRVFLLVLTGLSFTTAVFGVFAVIYVTIYARRLEIGMMKAIGTQNKVLTGTLIVEAITMTLGAALAGIFAGTTMGYLLAIANNVQAQRPMVFAFDYVVSPFIVFMVVLASAISAGFSARRIIKRKAVEILRMV